MRSQCVKCFYFVVTAHSKTLFHSHIIFLLKVIFDKIVYSRIFYSKFWALSTCFPSSSSTVCMQKRLHEKKIVQCNILNFAWVTMKNILLNYIFDFPLVHTSFRYILYQYITFMCFSLYDYTKGCCDEMTALRWYNQPWAPLAFSQIPKVLSSPGYIHRSPSSSSRTRPPLNWLISLHLAAYDNTSVNQTGLKITTLTTSSHFKITFRNISGQRLSFKNIYRSCNNILNIQFHF